MPESPIKRAKKYQERNFERFTELAKTNENYNFQANACKVSLEALELIEELNWEHVILARLTRKV